MMQKKSEDAVSPVIGVMLMLVVTIVIAGVIAVFGTGMVGTTESAPSAVLDVKIMTNFGALDVQNNGEVNADAGMLTGPDFQITHVSGDPIDTGDIEIQIAWKDHLGNYHDSTYSADAFEASGVTLPRTRSQPMYVKASTIGGGVSDMYFGDVKLTPGLRLTASTDFLGDVQQGSQNHIGSEFMNAVFASGETFDGFNSLDDMGVMEYLLPGTPVDITILHIPSNTIIYEKEVVVQ